MRHVFHHFRLADIKSHPANKTVNQVHFCQIGWLEEEESSCIHDLLLLSDLFYYVLILYYSLYVLASHPVDILE